mgnify:CR=1 FL=1
MHGIVARHSSRPGHLSPLNIVVVFVPWWGEGGLYQTSQMIIKFRDSALKSKFRKQAASDLEASLRAEVAMLRAGKDDDPVVLRWALRAQELEAQVEALELQLATLQGTRDDAATTTSDDEEVARRLREVRDALSRRVEALVVERSNHVDELAALRAQAQAHAQTQVQASPGTPSTHATAPMSPLVSYAVEEGHTPSPNPKRGSSTPSASATPLPPLHVDGSVDLAQATTAANANAADAPSAAHPSPLHTPTTTAEAAVGTPTSAFAPGSDHALHTPQTARALLSAAPRMLLRSASARASWTVGAAARRRLLAPTSPRPGGGTPMRLRRQRLEFDLAKNALEEQVAELQQKVRSGRGGGGGGGGLQLFCFGLFFLVACCLLVSSGRVVMRRGCARRLVW